MYGKSTVERDIEPERSRMQNSISQLDSLLDDLQQVKKSSYSEKGIRLEFPAKYISDAKFCESNVFLAQLFVFQRPTTLAPIQDFSEYLRAIFQNRFYYTRNFSAVPL